ncbi:flagellar basal body L-ring protein FlgH [Prosthecomicrobium sp. N25]|uniref:flagellar basal body L-ring protein FlgH n=1 Tax=Prosthecomicrobium sp. N25 TaxID=3129254 RepID=UPI0030769A36
MTVSRILLLALAAAPLGACSNTLDRLSNVGDTPKLTAIKDPTAQPGYKPVSLPMPDPQVAAYAPNSLWRSGARAFFKDQRAARVGDILTVKVTIGDKAEIDNETKRSRSTTETDSVGGVPGYYLQKVIPTETSASNLVATTAKNENAGSGSVNRSEKLETNVAAVVTQVLPNGNLVVEGRQEIRVNFEIRELIVAGIIRPEDIAADNTIESTKIAEARIAYGGRGQITDVQQPRYGNQVLDIILPF